MKIKTIKTEKVQYSEICPVCKREIKGYSFTAMLYNLQVHLERTHQMKQKDRETILKRINKEKKQ